MAKVIEGICKLCGEHKSLTFEHVPPKNAYNKGRYRQIQNNVLIDDPFLENSKGRLLQGGVGFYSLCEECNSKTGAWYGKSYVDFDFYDSCK